MIAHDDLWMTSIGELLDTTCRAVHVQNPIRPSRFPSIKTDVEGEDQNAQNNDIGERDDKSIRT